MNTRYKKYLNITDHWGDIQVKYILFIFVMTFSMGMFTYLLMEAGEKSQLSEYIRVLLSQTGGNENLWQGVWLCFKGNALMLVIAFLSGFTGMGRYVSLVPVMWKATTLGFSSVLLIYTLGAKGIISVVVCLLPQNLLAVPALIMGGAFAMDFGSKHRPGSGYMRQKNTGAAELHRYCVRFIILAIILMVSAVTDRIFPMPL